MILDCGLEEPVVQVNVSREVPVATNTPVGVMETVFGLTVRK